MKGLSIRQPWADLIARGVKTIEVRFWRRPVKLDLPRRIALHASKTPDMDAFRYLLRHRRAVFAGGPVFYKRGAIIGTAKLVEIRKYANPDEFNADADAHLNPPLDMDTFLRADEEGIRIIGLVFADAMKFKQALPYKGRLGFFDVPGNAAVPAADEAGGDTGATEKTECNAAVPAADEATEKTE